MARSSITCISRDARQRLNPGGRCYVVTISGLRRFIEPAFKEVFGNYTKVKQGKDLHGSHGQCDRLKPRCRQGRSFRFHVSQPELPRAAHGNGAHRALRFTSRETWLIAAENRQRKRATNRPPRRLGNGAFSSMRISTGTSTSPVAKTGTPVCLQSSPSTTRASDPPWVASASGPTCPSARPLTDALRLSRAMTFKSAMARIPCGGGKCVVVGDPSTVKTTGTAAGPGKVRRQFRRALHRRRGLRD